MIIRAPPSGTHLVLLTVPNTISIGLWGLSFLVNFERAKEPDYNTIFLKFKKKKLRSAVVMVIMVVVVSMVVLVIVVIYGGDCGSGGHW